LLLWLRNFPAVFISALLSHTHPIMCPDSFKISALYKYFTYLLTYLHWQVPSSAVLLAWKLLLTEKQSLTSLVFYDKNVQKQLQVIRTWRKIISVSHSAKKLWRIVFNSETKTRNSPYILYECFTFSVRLSRSRPFDHRWPYGMVSYVMKWKKNCNKINCSIYWHKTKAAMK